MAFRVPSGGGGGGGTPGGSDTQLQFNNAGSFGGITGATTNGTTVTLTNPTLITPTIASFANASHDHDDAAGGGQLNATNVFSAGTVPTARLGSGTADNTTFLRGDQIWAVPSGGGGGTNMGLVQAVKLNYANTWITALS